MTGRHVGTEAVHADALACGQAAQSALTVVTGEARRSRLHDLRRFVGLTLLLSWGICGVGLALRGWVPGMLPATLPIAAFAPSVSALLVAGQEPLRSLVRPVPPSATAIALLALPATAFAVHAFTARTVPVPGAYALLAIAAPFGEELGWRGLLLPRLLEIVPPVRAALLVGLAWIAWHGPAFLIPGTMSQTGAAIAWWAAGTLALSLLMTWLFLHANGNPFVAGFVPHLAVNLLGLADLWRYTPAEVAALLVLVASLLLWRPIAGDDAIKAR